MSEIILCMYSGGLGSAGALHALLTRDEYKDYQVHVHHLLLVNPENRAPVEQAVTQAALKYLLDSGCRKFSYSESMHKYPAFNRRMILDTDLCAFMAGSICNASPDIRQVALGRTKGGAGPDEQAQEARLAHSQGIFQAVKSLNPNPSEYIFPVAHLTKRELWEALPQELRERTWSCRTPVYDKEHNAHACGRCSACRAMGVAPAEPAPAAPATGTPET